MRPHVRISAMLVSLGPQIAYPTAVVKVAMVGVCDAGRSFTREDVAGIVRDSATSTTSATPSL